MYDGLLDATSALDSSASHSLSGFIDGDVLSYGNLTLSDATFDSAHTGSRTVNATFSGAMPTYSGGGATWSVAGYSGAGNMTAAFSGTIQPRPITTGIIAVGKTYDGMTDTTSTLTAPTGFVGNDSATGVDLSLAFDNPNAGSRNMVASSTGPARLHRCGPRKRQWRGRR